MQLTAKVIKGFSLSLLSGGFDNFKPTPEFHEDMWELCCLPHPKVAIAAPRGHAKSTAVTHAFVLARLLFRLSKYAVVISETETQSKQFLHDIKKELTDNDKLKKLFRIGGFLKENETEIVVQFEDKSVFRVACRGSGQAVRGLKVDGARPDLIVGDDLEGDEQVANQERREKFRRWFFGALLPVLSDVGIIRIVGTVMGFDSLLERLMPENQIPKGVDKEKYLVVTPLSVKSTYPGIVWVSVRYRAHNEDFTSILWPEKFSKERLEAIRADYAQQGMPEAYSQEYLNYPLDAATAFFRAEDFLPIKKKDEYGVHYISMDLAVSTKTKANRTVFVVGQRNSTNKLKIVNIVIGRIDSLEIAEKIFSLYRTYKPEFFVVEKGPIWSAIEPLVSHMMHEKDLFFDIKTYAATQDKMARAQVIRARMRAGQVEFDTDAQWFPEAQQELLQFPKSALDDIVDGMAWLGIALNELGAASSEEELLEEEYNQAYAESGLSFSGANPTTGY